MTYGTSIFLIAVGAIMRFAVSVHTDGFNIHSAGVILMIVGALGLLFSLLYAAMWRDRMAERRGGVIEERPVYRDRV